MFFQSQASRSITIYLSTMPTDIVHSPSRISLTATTRATIPPETPLLLHPDHYRACVGSHPLSFLPASSLPQSGHFSFGLQLLFSAIGHRMASRHTFHTSTSLPSWLVSVDSCTRAVEDTFAPGTPHRAHAALSISLSIGESLTDLLILHSQLNESS